MKEGIHPNYHVIDITCSCGNAFKVGSTLDKDKFHIEVCSKCHPFYTGKHKTALGGSRRVEKFKKRYERKAKPTDDTKKAA